MQITHVFDDFRSTAARRSATRWVFGNARRVAARWGSLGVLLAMTGCGNTPRPETSAKPHEIQMQQAIAAVQAYHAGDSQAVPQPIAQMSEPLVAPEANAGSPTPGPDPSQAVSEQPLTEPGVHAPNRPHSGADRADAPTTPTPVATSAPAERGRFVPPFPERRNLFLLPEGVRPELAQATRRQAGDVQLKGFVHVDGLRALVEIDGEVTVLRAGETHRGIQLLELHPPQATFQRGERRWTVSLWDDLARPSNSNRRDTRRQPARSRPTRSSRSKSPLQSSGGGGDMEIEIGDSLEADLEKLGIDGADIFRQLGDDEVLGEEPPGVETESHSDTDSKASDSTAPASSAVELP